MQNVGRQLSAGAARQSRSGDTRREKGLQLRVGQLFNPYKLFTGIFIPEALAKYRGVSCGAKLVYGNGESA